MMARFLKDIPDRRTSLFLLMYVAGTAVFFVFLLFPGDDVRKFAEKTGNGLHPDIGVSVGGAGLSPFLWVVLKDVTFSYKDNALIRSGKFRIRPSILSVLGRTSCSFSSKMFGGAIRGRFKRRGTQNTVMDVRFKELRMEETPLENYLSRYLLTGELKGTCHLEADGGSFAGKTALVVENGAVKFKGSVFGLDSIGFETAEATMSLKYGKVAIEGAVNGSQITGTFSGDIMLRRPFSSSVLKMKGFVKPHASLIAQLGETFPMEMLVRKTSGDKGLPVTVSGTIAEPGLAMK